MSEEITVEKSRKPRGEPTGIPLRFGAFVYDFLLIISIWMMTLWILIWVNDGEAIYGYSVQAILLLEVLIFYAYCWHRTGQTLGMKAWKIKLVNEDGNLPDLRQISIRLLITPVSILALGLGFLWFYFGNKQQTWHDRASETLVVKLSTKPKI